MTTEERLAKVEKALENLQTGIHSLGTVIISLVKTQKDLVQNQREHNGDTQRLVDELHLERGAAGRSALAAEAAWEKLQSFINSFPGQADIRTTPGTPQ